MRAAIFVALCAMQTVSAFNMMHASRVNSVRLAMKSKDFYPFSDKTVRSSTELLAKNAEDDTKNQGARQLLGIKGALPLPRIINIPVNRAPVAAGPASRRGNLLHTAPVLLLNSLF